MASKQVISLTKQNDGRPVYNACISLLVKGR